MLVKGDMQRPRRFESGRFRCNLVITVACLSNILVITLWQLEPP